MQESIISVFAKPPVPGRVKTRLAGRWGNANAALLARAFLHDTWAVASSIPGTRLVLATTGGSLEDFGLPDQPEIWLQGDGDLGDRLERIAMRGLAAAEFVIALGADSPGIPARLLADAVEVLARTEAVLGPAEDGGLYLIGLKRCPRGLLGSLPWSMKTTFAAIRERLDARAMSWDVLDPWFDVDRPEDLERLRSMILRSDISAPETAKLLTCHLQGATCAST